MQAAQCGNFGNSLSHFFDKNFVKATVLLNKLRYVTKDLISRKKFLGEREFPKFPHCVCTSLLRLIHFGETFFVNMILRFEFYRIDINLPTPTMYFTSCFPDWKMEDLLPLVIQLQRKIYYSQ